MLKMGTRVILKIETKKSIKIKTGGNKGAKNKRGEWGL